MYADDCDNTVPAAYSADRMVRDEFCLHAGASVEVRIFSSDQYHDSDRRSGSDLSEEEKIPVAAVLNFL